MEGVKCPTCGKKLGATITSEGYLVTVAFECSKCGFEWEIEGDM